MTVKFNLHYNVCFYYKFFNYYVLFSFLMLCLCAIAALLYDSNLVATVVAP